MVDTSDGSEVSNEVEAIGMPLTLNCGVVLKNRLVKAAMSDSLGNGAGDPTAEQIRLYQRWADGGTALSIIGEVQVEPHYPEKPGNIVLSAESDEASLRLLAEAGSGNGAHIWPQLGHAGALAFGQISRPAGPSKLDIDGLKCDELSEAAIKSLPSMYAAAARRSQVAGFGGVEVHAGHGFLLSQFLSPLFNRRTDRYGGPIEARCEIILEIVRQIRREVGSEFAIAVKLNSSDQLEGGLTEDESLRAVELVGAEEIDLIEISGGTYFPGAAASSDRPSSGPYYSSFAKRARTVTDTALMMTGGIKTRREAAEAVSSGTVDVVGLARSMVVDPNLPTKWLQAEGGDPEFPRFQSPQPGSVTAWYTMRLTALANETESDFRLDAGEALAAYDARDADRITTWQQRFAPPELRR